MGATHFKIVGAVGLVSDYSYNSDSKEYEADVPEENSIGVVVGSTIRSLETNSTAINLTATVPGGILPTLAVNVVACLGIEFYQKVDGNDYILSQGNTMKVTNVF